MLRIFFGALLLSFLIAGCGGGGGDSNTSTSNSTESGESGTENCVQLPSARVDVPVISEYQRRGMHEGSLVDGLILRTVDTLTLLSDTEFMRVSTRTIKAFNPETNLTDMISEEVSIEGKLASPAGDTLDVVEEKTETITMLPSGNETLQSTQVYSPYKRYQIKYCAGETYSQEYDTNVSEVETSIENGEVVTETDSFSESTRESVETISVNESITVAAGDFNTIHVRSFDDPEIVDPEKHSDYGYSETWYDINADRFVLIRDYTIDGDIIGESELISTE